MNAWRGFRAVAISAGQLLRAVVVGTARRLKAFLSAMPKLLRSVRVWVLVTLLLIAALITYYIFSDLYTPFTTEAYVQAYVIQVAPRVEGQVVRVCVEENQAVSNGDLLFEIDPRPYEHQVELLTAKRVEAV